MRCEISFSLIQESLLGEIGEEWEYLMRIEVHNDHGLLGVGGIKVPNHTLKPGTTQPSPVLGAVVLPAGGCDEPFWVRLILEAKEVDFIVDDQGSNELVVKLNCPGQGRPSSVSEPSLTARIREAPRFVKGQAALTVKARLTARCG